MDEKNNTPLTEPSKAEETAQAPVTQTPLEAPQSAPADVTQDAEEKKEKNDPLASFLAREEQKDKERFSVDPDEKKKKIPWWITIPAAVVIVLVVILLILNLNPKPADDENLSREAEIEVTVNDKGEHQANVVLNENGELEQNGSGTLLSYAVSAITQVDVENQKGSFTVTSHTPTATNESGEEETDTTVYTLVGFEGFELQSGAADAVANDASNLSFTSVAAVNANLSDFGFDTPQAKVNVKYNDNTTSLITVGADAPSAAGTYITFGEGNTVYLTASDAVDAFLYAVNDLISLSVNTSADNVDNSQFSSLEISGSRYDTPITLAPNNDEAIKTEYLITSPVKMFASPTESADIAGAIRGVYAEKVLCVNPSDGQLSQYGLSEPYARVVAVYPDTTVELIASAPDAEGYLNLMSKDKAVIYSIQLGAVEWANTSLSKLRPVSVLDINKEAVSSITVDAKTIQVTTTTESVENDEGDYEDVTSVTAEYNGTRLKDENFSVFFQNLAGMQLLDSQDAGSGVMCEIRISYTTGRADDVITIENSASTHLPVALNGEIIGSVYRSYIEKFLSGADNLFNGKTVKSL